MLVGELLWMAVVHSATVHPLQSSKQAKVTSGQLGLYILWLVVYLEWRWEQRVVDVDSKEGISSSYFMCVCVCVCVCVCTISLCEGSGVVCVCIYVTAMWLILNTVWCILSRKWKHYCSEHAQHTPVIIHISHHISWLKAQIERSRSCKMSWNWRYCLLTRISKKCGMTWERCLDQCKCRQNGRCC